MRQKHTASLLFLCFGLMILFSCQGSQKNSNDLNVLLSWMTGSFSSQEQAQSDTNYFDIRLHMVQIWPDRADGKWLYVEQSTAQNLSEPYRQRVYNLTQVNDSTFRSTVYSFDEPLRFAGEWQKAAPLAQLTPDSLEEREGCSIFLTWKEEAEAFVGSTVDKKCVSTHRGASYAISEVIVTEGGLSTWDRGFNDKNEQVWGARTGGYIFLKTEDR